MNPPKRWLTLSLAASSTIFLTACPRNEYIVELKPDGDSLERTLICQRYELSGDTRTPQDFPESELAALKALYSRHEFDPATKRHIFRGRSTGVTPKDVGGAGSHSRWVTSLGSVGQYTERFRGQDDQWARLQNRAKSADSFVNLAVGWLETELGQEPGFPKLRRFLDDSFRPDLKNASLLMLQAELIEQLKPDAVAEFALRAAQYFLERGYFRREQVPQLLMFIDGPDTEAEFVRFFRSWLAERLGLPPSAPMPSAFAFLNNSSAAEASWTKFMRTTELYQARLKAWEADPNKDPNAGPPDPAEVGLEAALLAFEPDSRTPDELKVRLALPNAPFFTNGQWDAPARQVRWNTDIESGETRRLPAICYATWSEPDVEFQTRHLGKVALHGKSLGEYALWRVNLPETDATQWDGFLSSLKPADDLERALETFRFAGESQESPSKAAEAIALIKAGLAAERAK